MIIHPMKPERSIFRWNKRYWQKWFNCTRIAVISSTYSWISGYAKIYRSRMIKKVNRAYKLLVTAVDNIPFELYYTQCKYVPNLIISAFLNLVINQSRGSTIPRYHSHPFCVSAAAPVMLCCARFDFHPTPALLPTPPPDCWLLLIEDWDKSEEDLKS